jgi:hypothetical protein
MSHFSFELRVRLGVHLDAADSASVVAPRPTWGIGYDVGRHQSGGARVRVASISPDFICRTPSATRRVAAHYTQMTL